MATNLLIAQTIIGALSAWECRTSGSLQEGADAVLDALDAAGYVVVTKEELAKWQ